MISRAWSDTGLSSSLNRAVAEAPGKLILTGEHAVVYGGPAVAMAIALHARAEASFRADSLVKIESRDLGFSCVFDEQGKVMAGKKWIEQARPLYSVVKAIREEAGRKAGMDIKVESQIPVGVGLGSSAAVAVAVAAASSKLFELDMERIEISKVAYRSEMLVHGRPSGIDNTISAEGGIILFERGRARRLRAPKGIPIVVGNTGIVRSTGELVARVREFVKQCPEVARGILSTIGKLSRQVSSLIERGDLERVGMLMSVNHELLAALGVSTEALDGLVHSARRAGALGSKLTGAGGGGCVIALAEGEAAESVARAWQESGIQVFQARLDEVGVRSWTL